MLFSKTSERLKSLDYIRKKDSAADVWQDPKYDSVNNDCEVLPDNIKSDLFNPIKKQYQKQPPEVILRKLFLEISQYSQENACVEVSFLIKKSL